MKRCGVGLLLGALVLVVGCDDQERLGLGQGGAGAAQAGQSGKAGQSGTAGQGGNTAGTGGVAGQGGTAGDAGNAGNAGAAGQTQAGPVVVTATSTESTPVPLAGTLEVKLDRSARVRVGVDDGQGHTFTLTTGAAATSHTIPVLQLRAARSYTLTVTAFDDGGDGLPKQLTRATAPLPADFPPIEVLAKDASSSGLTLFPVGRFKGTGSDGSWSYVIATDSSGEVVWYFQALSGVSDVRLTSKGDVRLQLNEVGLLEGTALGEPKRLLVATGQSGTGQVPTGAVGVPLDTIHHDVVELPNGHLLALSTEAKVFTPAQCPVYDKEYTVVGDVVAEIDPDTGKVLHRTSLFDLIDPCRRIDDYFKSPFWVGQYGPNAADWTHANSVFYDAASNRVLVSSRHQDWVIGYRYAADASGPANELLFKFGVEGDFTLTGTDALFPYHQHAAKIASNGNLMMFDNGTSRPGTLDSDVTKLPRSRGVEYELSTTGPKSGWQAKQVWEFGSKEVRFTDTSTGSPVDVGYYAPVIGETDLTPADTVLITQGALMMPVTGFVLDPAVKKSARIVEVTHDASPKIVMDLRIEDKAATNFSSYAVYRAKRIATLYPASSGVTVTTP